MLTELFLVWFTLSDPCCISFVKVDGGSEAANDMANTMMQNFWDSAFALEPADQEFDTNRYILSSFSIIFSLPNVYL